MEFLWWQVCLITLCKGFSWMMPIFAVFLGFALLINWLIKDETGKVKQVLSRKE